MADTDERKKPRRRTTRKAATAKPKTATPKLDVPPPPPVVCRSVRPESVVSLAVAAGAPPKAQTIVYIHGIGNKPPASVLKCQWDSALFGVELGDRSRLAYWVNREYYPTPSDDTCTGEDVVRIDDDEITTQSILALARRGPTTEDEALTAEIEALTDDPRRRDWLAALSRKLNVRADAEPLVIQAAEVRAKILPLPGFLRRLITRKLSRAFLRDVHDFFFVPNRQRIMEQSIADRLNAGGGPFVVIAHSQGSMIAYNVLRQLNKANCDVQLLVTIGSPLGLTEVQDVLRQWTGGRLPFPPCVARWVNVADPLDPVAADTTLGDEYEGAVEDRETLNPDSPRHPHSGTGYLKTQWVQDAVREIVGNAFVQAVGRTIIVKDLVEDLEDGLRTQRHRTLIQLSAGDAGESLDTVRANVTQAIEAMVENSGDPLSTTQIQPLKRYVAALLARAEIEQLRTRFADLHIERVWRDAAKRALICDSTHTVQASPAILGYGTSGQGIGWAVLDTGIRGNHPHFAKYKNVKLQWDCTQPGAPQEYRPRDPGFADLDKQGHGTHVAGIIAGELKIPFETESVPRLFAGMAPETELYGFKVLDDRGNGQDSWIIKALDKIADVNEAAGQLVIAGVNLNLGGNFDPSVYACGHTPLCQELRRLWNQGVLVCLAAGNEGYALLQAATGIFRQT